MSSKIVWEGYGGFSFIILFFNIMIFILPLLLTRHLMTTRKIFIPLEYSFVTFWRVQTLIHFHISLFFIRTDVIGIVWEGLVDEHAEITRLFHKIEWTWSDSRGMERSINWSRIMMSLLNAWWRLIFGITSLFGCVLWCIHLNLSLLFKHPLSRCD